MLSIDYCEQCQEYTRQLRTEACKSFTRRITAAHCLRCDDQWVARSWEVENDYDDIGDGRTARLVEEVKAGTLRIHSKREAV